MEPSPQPDEETPPRPGFFRWLTVGTSAIAAAFFGIPVVGYLLKPKKRPIDWVALGKVGDFAVDETRMVTFDNPIRQPWDGMTAHTGVYVRNNGKDDQRKDQFLVLAVNCAPGMSGLLVPAVGLIHVSVPRRCLPRDRRTHSGPPPRGLFHCVWRVKDGHLEVQAPHYPTLQDTLEQPA